MKRVFLMSVGALMLAAGFAVTAEQTSAQMGPLVDHLKCYKVSFKKGEITISPHANGPLVFRPLQNPPFTTEDGCRLLPAQNPRPRFVCVPVDKAPRQAPVGQQLTHDYLIYAMRCPQQPDFKQGVQDQFIKGVANVHRKSVARLLLVPAYKIDTPPPPCEPTAPHMCGGTCPTGEVCQPGPTDICGCFPTPCSPDAAGQCNGTCPNPGEICVQPLGTTDCRCEVPNPCSVNAAGQCGGDCSAISPTLVCLFNTNLQICRCEPPGNACSPDLGGACVGFCPAVPGAPGSQCAGGGTSCACS